MRHAEKGTVTIAVELPRHEAEALARLVKRMTFDDVLKLAAGRHPEAHDALAAILKVKRALADKVTRRAERQA